MNCTAPFMTIDSKNITQEWCLLNCGLIIDKSRRRKTWVKVICELDVQGGWRVLLKNHTFQVDLGTQDTSQDHKVLSFELFWMWCAIVELLHCYKEKKTRSNQWESIEMWLPTCHQVFALIWTCQYVKSRLYGKNRDAEQILCYLYLYNW